MLHFFHELTVLKTQKILLILFNDDVVYIIQVHEKKKDYLSCIRYLHTQLILIKIK